MLTGDSRATAEAVARQLGIDRVASRLFRSKRRKPSSSCRPRVASWRWPVTESTMLPLWLRPTSVSPWGREPMWLWKAPALRSSQGDLRGIVRALRLSRATMRNIRQNLFFAFVYNVLGIPIAAGLPIRSSALS